MAKKYYFLVVRLNGQEVYMSRHETILDAIKAKINSPFSDSYVVIQVVG